MHKRHTVRSTGVSPIVHKRHTVTIHSRNNGSYGSAWPSNTAALPQPAWMARETTPAARIDHGDVG